MERNEKNSTRRRLVLACSAVVVVALLSVATAFAVSKAPGARGRAEVKTSANAILNQRLDSTLRKLATTKSTTTVDVLVFVARGTNVPKQIIDPIRIRLLAEKSSNVYAGKVRGNQLTKLATSPNVRRVADNRSIKPPRIPDIPGPDSVKLKAAGKKASARIQAANKAGVTKEWVKSFDAQGRLKNTAKQDASAAKPDGASGSDGSGGGAPTGWFDVGPTHRSSVAWDKGYTGAGVRVGVADSGVDFAHPDLQSTEATVTDPSSPYFGWPMAYDPYSLLLYATDAQLGTTYVSQGYSWFSDTHTEVSRGPSGFATFEEVSYRLPATSISGSYHMGYLNDEHLGDYGIIFGYDSGMCPVLVTDEQTSGVYNTVRVDLNANEDFTDDKPCTKASPISYLDYWDSAGDHPGSDGYADLSGGMVYWISDGSNQPPGYDLHFEGGTKPGAGDMVSFMGAFDWLEDHGTLCSSNIVGQGNIDGASALGDYPSFKTPGSGGIVQGGGKDASLVAIGNVYAAPSAFLMAYDYAAVGPDAELASGDELQVLSCSFGFSSTDNDEWDYQSRYITELNDAYSDKTAYVLATGNGGPGYGTDTAPTPSTGIKVGASTQFGASGGWDSIVSSDQVTVGDIISWSNRGPSSMGKTAVDLVADGAYSSGALPLNMTVIVDHTDGWRAWDIWGGTSRSTPVVAGNLTLVDQAFYERHGRWPTWSEARALLMSGAKDLSYDSLVQGAGMLDAGRSVDLAAGDTGVRATPSLWSAGAFRGTSRDGFANIMSPDTTNSTNFTVTNEGSTPADVTFSDVWHQRAWTTTMSVTLDPSEESAYDFSRPDKLIDLTGTIPADTDLLVVRTVYPLSEMDPTASFDQLSSTKNDIRVLAYDWSDENTDGSLWTDGDGNGFVNTGEIESGEYERFNYGLGRATSHEIRVQNPKDRMHDGVFLGLQHSSRTAGGAPVHVTVEISGWNRVDWPWLTLSSAGTSIAANDTFTLGATMHVPSNAPPGIYDGQILLNDGTNNTVIPVAVNVAGQGAATAFGGASPYETLMDNTKLFGYQDWTWRDEAGDWRFFMTDVPDTPSLPTGARWLAHTSWESTPTDNDTLLYGPFTRPSGYPSGPVSFFGPYDLASIGGSTNTLLSGGLWTFETATGGPNEWVSGPLTKGLNEIMLHSTLYSGTRVGEPFAGSAGVVASQPSAISLRSGAATGSVPITFSTQMDLPGLATQAAGLTQIKSYSSTISDQQTWSQYFDIADAPYVDVKCACDSADIDLYLYWRPDDAHDWIRVGASETASGNEEIKVKNPTPGNYRIDIFGWDVPVADTPFTASVDAPEGPNLFITGEPDGAINAGSTYTMNLHWSRPGTAPYPDNNVYRGVVYLGVPDAPQIVEIPVSLTVDITPPAAASGLKAVAGYRSAALSWKNISFDYAATRVYRSTTRYATAPADTLGQTKVMEKSATSLKQTSLTSYKRYYYTVFERDTAGNWSIAAKTSVVPQGYATLGRPKLSVTRPRHGRRFKVTGTISPRHPAQTTVKLYFYKKKSGTYRYYKSVTVYVKAGAGSYGKYVKLASRGSYYVKAYHADALHAGRYSSKKYFSVR